MIESIDTINFILALGTVGLQIATALLILVLFVDPHKRPPALVGVIRRYALPGVFVLSLAGVALTLFYSEIVGYTPCGLCWLQRVFLYPQPIILGIALWKQHQQVASYIIALSLFGAVVALYQYYIQFGGIHGIGCPTAGELADCTRRYVYVFNYITFPMMSLTSFIFTAVLMRVYQKVS